jgi:hypothetical protein
MRSSEIFYQMTHMSGNMESPSGALVAMFFMVMMIALLFVMIFWAGIESFFRTVITVDREFITIGRKRMPRADFGGFSIAHTLGKEEAAVLGYSFGSRAFSFGGVWELKQAREVASALNRHLRYPLDFILRDGGDHSYYFIASFIGEHIAHHARFLF